MKYTPTLSEYIISRKTYLIKAQKSKNNSWRIQHSIDVEKYNEFCNSQPKLGDFVACNKKGELVKEPLKWGSWTYGTLNLSALTYAECTEYQNALDRVLWTEWEVNGDCAEQIINGKQLISKYDNLWDETYEKLITSVVKLERIERK
ncbi:MAG: hypothetical protein IIC74_04105 [Bacteroidetes bacterium]|nr:hypothetical protein [Bacteroidota bacterium]